MSYQISNYFNNQNIGDEHEYPSCFVDCEDVLCKSQ